MSLLRSSNSSKITSRFEWFDFPLLNELLEDSVEYPLLARLFARLDDEVVEEDSEETADDTDRVRIFPLDREDFEELRVDCLDSEEMSTRGGKCPFSWNGEDRLVNLFLVRALECSPIVHQIYLLFLYTGVWWHKQYCLLYTHSIILQ